MEAHEIAAPADRGVKRRDIRVSDHRLRSTPQCCVIEAIEDAHRTVAAANAPDRIDAIVGNRGVEIGESLIVAAREIAIARQRMRARDWLPPQAARVLDRMSKIFFTAQRPRGCDESDARTCCDGWPFHRTSLHQWLRRVHQ